MADVKRLEDETIIDETDAAGTPAKRYEEAGEDAAPLAPNTSGASQGEPDTSRNPLANRNTEGPRQAGVTPRPTDKPIVGGGRG